LRTLCAAGANTSVGWRWHNGLGKALLAFGLLLLLRFAVLWLGIYLGLIMKNRSPLW
jgi:ABC-2 type transport system permease protein